VPEKYKWDLTHLYKSDEDWYEAKYKVSERMDTLSQFKGKFAESSTNLKDCLQFSTELLKELRRLSSYSWNKTRQDLRDSKYRAMDLEMNQLFTKYNAYASFIKPEILAMEKETAKIFLETEPGLQPYTFLLNDILRQKKYILSEAEEKVIAQAGRMSSDPASIYNTLINSDFARTKVTLSSGETIKLDRAGYQRYRRTSNRKDRELVYKTFYGDVNNMRDTFGALMNAKINANIFNTRVRGYKDCLEMTLEPNNIPVEIYHNLIANANKHLDEFHRYLKIKKRLLGRDSVEYIDLSVPAFGDLDLKYDLEEAKELILESLKPLGATYTSVVKKAFESRWIDYYPTHGKRSNSYNDMGAYREHPYILTNFMGRYQDVFALTHELGHALHRYYADRSQSFPASNYPSFVAEVASIFNEKLLIREILNSIEDENARLYLLMNSIDRSLFDRAQISEFELRIHQEAERGNALTGDSVSRIYLETLRKYYGHDQGVCTIPDYIDMAWIFDRLLFLRTYHLYVYATSQIAATSLVEKVLAGEKDADRKYLDFLSAGGSDYPVNLLRKAGVDLISEEPFAQTMDVMVRTMDEIENIIGPTSH
jgi:oligoendopeptidase F